ncbi:MAG: 4Fe-4S binding protein [Dehalococcoidia bacterium]|nr:4Fe-4S binding protein [Dehalococcoidia bacterium]
MSENLPLLDAKKKLIYQNFITWLENSWYGAPASEILLPLIALKYTPEEAELLTGIPFSPKSIDTLAELKKMDKSKLEKKLDELTLKGLVYHFKRDGINFYNANDIFMVMRTSGWPGKKEEANKNFARLADNYFPDFMKPWEAVSEKGLRVLPINAVIEDNHTVLPYEEIKSILNSYTFFCVTHCPCRMKKNLTTEKADPYPTEVCLHFDRLGHYIVDSGLGREISRQETAEILQKCADLGLVHAISNQQEAPDTICNCCNCCCMWFESVKRLKHANGFVPSNFHVSVSATTCTGCGLCVKRCPMEALKLKEMPEYTGRKITIINKNGKQQELTNKTGKISEVDNNLCIGCGVCAYKCPSKSLKLIRNTTEHHPPRTGRDWVVQFMTETRSIR